MMGSANVTLSVQWVSATKAITAFHIVSPVATGVISGTSIAVTVPYGTNVANLVATFATTGVSVKVGSVTQVSGSTANDFTNPVTYVITALDGTMQDYVVTVGSSPLGAATWDASKWDQVTWGN